MNTKLIFASLSAGFIATSAMSADLGAADIAQPLPPQGGVADIIHDWGAAMSALSGWCRRRSGNGDGFRALFSERPCRRSGGVTAAQHPERQHGYGVEADVSWRRPRATKPVKASRQNCYYELGWQGTARARIGVAMDRTLLYVTGGLAV